MIKKLTLNLHGLKKEDRHSFSREFLLAIEIHNMLAKITMARKLIGARSLRVCLNEVVRNCVASDVTVAFDPVFRKQEADIECVFDCSYRMTSSMRCSPAVEHIFLNCVWFGGRNEIIGNLSFCVHKNGVVASFLPGQLAKNLRGV